MPIVISFHLLDRHMGPVDGFLNIGGALLLGGYRKDYEKYNKLPPNRLSQTACLFISIDLYCRLGTACSAVTTISSDSLFIFVAFPADEIVLCAHSRNPFIARRSYRGLPEKTEIIIENEGAHGS